MLQCCMYKVYCTVCIQKTHICLQKFLERFKRLNTLLFDLCGLNIVDAQRQFVNDRHGIWQEGTVRMLRGGVVVQTLQYQPNIQNYIGKIDRICYLICLRRAHLEQ